MQIPFHPRKAGPGHRGWETQKAFTLRMNAAEHAQKLPHGNPGDKLRRKMLKQTLTKKA